MNLEKRIHHLGGSIALLIISLFLFFSQNVTYTVRGQGFLGAIIFFILSLYHLFKYFKEKKE